ncbi:GAF and HD-GYP domain-containing protein [Castellaniella ginsengisoli]|uniref:HD domain-containing phosphohydrolase n=1 Tax=Castellaniella ginsengisoli TaxID=546114 RepID=A0AB39D908_9BURK
MPLPIPPPTADQDTLRKLIGLTHALSAERHLPRLYDRIIEAAQDFTHADGGTLYILEGQGVGQGLRFEVMRTLSLDIRAGGDSGQAIDLRPIPLWLDDGRPNHQNVCAHVWHQGTLVNIADAYEVEDFDFSGTRAFDRAMHYRTVSLLTLPLQNHAGDIIGILQLVNARVPGTDRVQAFDPAFEPLVLALASSAAVTLDKQQLLQGHKDLLDAFIRTIAQAIDAKSAHTSAHCQRVPVLTELIAQAACHADTGPLKDFDLDDEGWYELRVAAWLHDCGKLATPDSLLDKSTKLHALSDRIETVQARYAALIAQETAAAANQGDARLQARILQLREDCDFLARANIGGEFMRPEDQQRVRDIAAQSWTDHTGAIRPLLTAEEADMLCIARGTLNGEERQRINRHIDVTLQMLEAMPFPKTLARVPEYAGGHHEKVDGTGFPRGLTGDQMSWPARMMAIADIFEALTARDRPYKPPMPLSQALSILRDMRDRRHIDADLYTLFLESRVWDIYAREHLLPEQLDVQDPAAYR